MNKLNLPIIEYDDVEYSQSNTPNFNYIEKYYKVSGYNNRKDFTRNNGDIWFGIRLIIENK